MYCATDEPVQHVHITPHASVSVEFHFAPTAKLGKRVRVVSLATAAERAKTGAPAEMTVGEIEQDGHLTTRAHAGTTFRVVDAASGRRLLEVQASYEAEQHIDVGTNVSLGVTLPAHAAGSAQLYWLWGGDDAFAREHLHATLHPGETLHVATMAGEAWVAKEETSGRLLQTITTTDAVCRRMLRSSILATSRAEHSCTASRPICRAPTRPRPVHTPEQAEQDIELVVPQGFAMRAPLARFARGVGASSRQ